MTLLTLGTLQIVEDKDSPLYTPSELTTSCYESKAAMTLPSVQGRILLLLDKQK